MKKRCKKSKTDPPAADRGYLGEVPSEASNQPGTLGGVGGQNAEHEVVCYTKT